MQTTSLKQIQQFCEQLAREFQPERIVLFGSHAYGKPHPFSDVDLLVVMSFDGSPLQQAARILTKLEPKMSVDLLVRTPEQVRQRLAMQDSFMQDILKRGKVTYEAYHPGMARNGQEWIDKAEGDFVSALTLYRARKHPN
jgi:predicted nucleotidyltransferase